VDVNQFVTYHYLPSRIVPTAAKPRRRRGDWDFRFLGVVLAQMRADERTRTADLLITS
jgi:hypothetical protein